MGSPQTNQCKADSPIYSPLGILRFYSARTCSRQRIARAGQEIACAEIRAINQRVLLFDFLP